MSIRYRISCALARRRRGTTRSFLPYAVVAALGVGLLASAPSVAEQMADWTPGTLRAANELFSPRSGWRFTIAPSGDTLIASLEGESSLRQAVQYNALGQVLKYTEVIGSQDDTVIKVKTNTYDESHRIIAYEETTFESSDPSKSITTTYHLSYNEAGEVDSEIEFIHETGVNTKIVVLNPGTLRFVDSAGNDLVLCRCTRCGSEDPR